jgi:uncharacterized membrane protein
MHRSAITILVLTAFTASAVLGLCAMTQQMMMHGGLCASGSIGSMVCPENPLRHFTLLAAFFAAFTGIVSLAMLRSVPMDKATLPVQHKGWRERALLSWTSPPGLSPLFSDGILNPKTF